MGTWMWALGKTVHALWCNRLSCFIVVFSGCRSLLFMPIEMIKCLTCGCGEVRCMACKKWYVVAPEKLSICTLSCACGGIRARFDVPIR